MNKSSKIYIAGHTGMVGSALVRKLKEEGYQHIIGKPLDELDLMNQQAVIDFFETEKPEYVILAAAKVGGIMANNTYRAQFIYENLMIQNNIIHSSYVYGVKKLLFLGSSCVYPKTCPQPIKEEYLLTGELEQTNEPYAIAKIAGIKMCENYYRQYGCNFFSVMPTNSFGPNDNYNLDTSHVLPALIRKIHLGKCLQNNNWTGLRDDLNKRPIQGIKGSSSKTHILEILGKYGIHQANPASRHQYQVIVTLWGTGQVYREFMHVDDTADACVFIFKNVNIKDLFKTTINSHSKSFTSLINIGTGNDLTIQAVAELVKKNLDYTGKLVWDHEKPDGTYKKLLDITMLKKFGFQPNYNLEDRIKSVYKLYLNSYPL